MELIIMRKIFKYVQELTLGGGMEDTSLDVHKAAHWLALTTSSTRHDSPTTSHQSKPHFRPGAGLHIYSLIGRKQQQGNFIWGGI